MKNQEKKDSSDEINYIMKENSIRLMISLGSRRLAVCNRSSSANLVSWLSKDYVVNEPGNHEVVAEKRDQLLLRLHFQDT